MKILSNEFKHKVASELKITNISLDNQDNLCIQHRYHSLYITLKKQLIDFETKLDELYSKLYIHYKFKSDYTLSSKGEVELFIKKNKEYQKYNKLVQLKKLEIERVKDIVDLFKSRGYTIKNAIDIQQMEMR